MGELLKAHGSNVLAVLDALDYFNMQKRFKRAAEKHLPEVSLSRAYLLLPVELTLNPLHTGLGDFSQKAIDRSEVGLETDDQSFRAVDPSTDDPRLS